MLKNTSTHWGAVAKALHWLMAITIIGQLVLGEFAESLRFSPQKLELFVWHKSVGVTVLLLVALRIGWRLGNAVPQPAEASRLIEQRMAQLGHVLLYALMLAVPLSGWWISDTSRIPFRLYGRIPVPDFVAADREASEFAASLHGFLATALLALVIIHVLAALRHHFLLRNDTLLRMLPFRRS